MEEMLDTFDINGNLLGAKPRSVCHSENPGFYHKAVWIWIMNSQNQLLVQKRALTKKKSPGKWDMPSAGHIDAGETCLQGCVRETREELGLDVKPEDFVFLKEVVNTRGWELAQVYLLKTDVKIKDFVLQEEEVERVRWLNFDEFVQLIYSDEFCKHDKAYKDWVCQTLKNQILINSFLAKAKKFSVNIDSIFVEENNVLTKEIVNDLGLHQLRSCSKLLVAFAYGIALNEKFQCKHINEVLSLDTKVYPTFSAIYKGQIPEQVKELTIRTLLTHSTGYEKMMFNEKHIENLDKNNLLEVLFNTEIKYKTGEHFTYSNVEPYLLSIFFQENFGINLADFVSERIFKPLQINCFTWENLGKYCAGATGLYLSPNDFHKLGNLIMNNGAYNGEQIVPSNWIEEMLKPQVACPDYYKSERLFPKLNAGYFTWLTRDDIIFRDGSEGQYIICDLKNNRLITIMATQKEMSLVSECLRGLI